MSFFSRVLDFLKTRTGMLFLAGAVVVMVLGFFVIRYFLSSESPKETSEGDVRSQQSAELDRLSSESERASEEILRQQSLELDMERATRTVPEDTRPVEAKASDLDMIR